MDLSDMQLQTAHPIMKPQGTPEMLKAQLESILSRSEAEVLHGFSPDGPSAGMNTEYLGAVEQMANLYALTKDPAYARWTVIMLYQFSLVSMEYPVVSRVGKPSHPLQPNWLDIGDGMEKVWSSWFYYDLREVSHLSRAYDLIYNSSELDYYGKELHIDLRAYMDNYFSYWWRVYTVHWPPNWGNMEGRRIWFMLDYAEPLGHPEWVREIVRWFDRLLYRGYLYDGFWHEGTPGYHGMVSERLINTMKRLQGYSDPPGYIDPVEGDRLENLDAQACWGYLVDRILNAQQMMRLPNGQFTAVNDSNYGDAGVPLEKSSPILLPGMGYAILGTGSGSNQFQLHLNWVSPFGHEHGGGLGIVMFADGEEILSEGQYRGDRVWQSSTPGHNTVVVNERTQLVRSEGKQFSINYGDRAVPTKDWVNIHACTGNSGNLLAFDAQPDTVMLVESEGQGLYGLPVTSYRRMLAVLPRPGHMPYVFDVFRVAGGTTHDWMVHGPLHSEYQITSNVAQEPRPDTLFGYIKNLQAGVTTSNVELDIRSTKGQGDLVTMVAGSKPAELLIGTAPAMRRAGDAQYAALRRTGTENVFVAIHNPYGPSDQHNLTAKMLSNPIAWNDPVVVEVQGETYRDVLVATADAPGTYVPRQYNDVTVAARFAWLRFAADGSLQEAMLLGGGYIQIGEQVIRAEDDWQGGVVGIGRKPAGAADYFDIEGQLPAGDKLTGRLLLLTLGDGSRQGYTITAVEQLGNMARVYVDQDPGLVMDDGGVQQVFFPNRCISGLVRYELLGRGQYVGR